MKICVINNLYPPYNRGGAEVVVENQVKKLASEGNQVVVVTTRPLFGDVGTRHGVFSSEIEIHRFYPWNIFSVYHIDKFPALVRLIWHGIDMFNLHSYFRIKKILKKEKPDIVYAHNLTGIGYLIPRLLKKMSKRMNNVQEIPRLRSGEVPLSRNFARTSLGMTGGDRRLRYIQVMHDVALVYPSGLLTKGKENCWLNRFWLTRLWGKINRYLFDAPDQVWFPSAWLEGFYRDRGFFKDSACKVVRNFDFRLLKHSSTKTLKHKGVVNFLYIGQIEEHKGILFLIKTAGKLPAASCQLKIVGDGSKLEQAKLLAKNNQNIKFYGWQTRDKIEELLKQTDYMVVPSLCYENSPTVIFESLRAGVPVIASDIGGIPEIIKDGVNGYLFEAGDDGSLLKLLNKLTRAAV